MSNCYKIHIVKIQFLPHYRLVEELLFCTCPSFKAHFRPFKWCAFVSPRLGEKSREERTHFPIANIRKIVAGNRA